MLKPESDAQIPEETAKIAKAAFPNGNIYLTLRDTLGPLGQSHLIQPGPSRDNPHSIRTVAV
jgi:hypothetical protein